jgi:uncharacterized protein (TIGR02757 family)
MAPKASKPKSGPKLRRRSDEELRSTLDAIRARCDLPARRAADPVGIVHGFDDPLDRELVGLLCATAAFGNVKTIRAKVRDLLDRAAKVAHRPSLAADQPAALRRALRGWKHRVFIGDDLARLLVGARKVQRAHGTLGHFFRAALDRHGALRPALADLCDAIRDAGDLRSKTRRGPAHLLPDPRGPSASKRLLLYLRWMVRPADGIDLGLWPVAPSFLAMPVDTHIHKLSRNLGLTGEKTLSWRATEEITSALARLDPSDPVKYDFSLCHLGMLQRCPSRRDPDRCDGCGAMPVCRHWIPRDTGVGHLAKKQKNVRP